MIEGKQFRVTDPALMTLLDAVQAVAQRGYFGEDDLLDPAMGRAYVDIAKLRNDVRVLATPPVDPVLHRAGGALWQRVNGVASLFAGNRAVEAAAAALPPDMGIKTSSYTPSSDGVLWAAGAVIVGILTWQWWKK